MTVDEEATIRDTIEENAPARICKYSGTSLSKFYLKSLSFGLIQVTYF